jgi:AcrR family transcriptional regulator
MSIESLPASARRTARTRQALIDAALHLFALNGYEATTTDDVTELAGVSPRTFFRHFPTKESVLFFGEDDFASLVAQRITATPAGQPDLDVLQECFVELATHIADLRRRVKLYEKAVASSPLLRGRERDSDAANTRVVAAALARRRGATKPDADLELVASLGFLMMRRAMKAWLRGPASGSLGAAIDAEFDRLRRIR